GRAPAGVLQRPDGAEPEDAVDAPDHVVGGLARAQLHGSGRKRLRLERDGLLLRSRRARVAVDRAARGQPGGVLPRPRGTRTPRSVPDLTDDVASRRSATRRAPPRVGADPLRVGPDVHGALSALHRDGRAVRADLAARLPPPGARS